MSGARGSLLKGVADIAVRAGGLVTFPILIRFAGADGYGSFGQVTTIVSFISPFASLGLTSSMVRFFSIRDWTSHTRGEFFRIALIVLASTTVVGTVFAFCAPFFSRYFLDYKEGTRLFAWGGLQIVITGAEQLLLNFFRSRQWYTQSSTLEICQAAISVASTVLLIPRGFGIVALLATVLFLKIILYTAFYLSLWTWNRPTSPGKGEPLKLNPMISFGISGIMAGLGIWMMNLGDRLVIGHYLPAAALGHYSAAYNLAYMVMAVNAPLLLTLYPRIQIALERRTVEDAIKEAAYFHRYISLIIIPSTIFLVCVASPALGFLGGKGFNVDSLMVGMIIVSVAVDQYNAVSHYVIYSKDQMVFNRNCWIAAGILNFLLNLLIVPQFGLRGAAFTTLVSFILLEALVTSRATRFIPLRKLFRFDVSLKAGLAGSVAALAIIPILRLHAVSKEGLILAAMVYTVVYLAGILLMKEIKTSDVDLIRRAVLGNRKAHA
jgi:O-antigen/teichoic acid export membrane protein